MIYQVSHVFAGPTRDGTVYIRTAREKKVAVTSFVPIVTGDRIEVDEQGWVIKVEGPGDTVWYKERTNLPLLKRIACSGAMDRAALRECVERAWDLSPEALVFAGCPIEAFAGLRVHAELERHRDLYKQMARALARGHTYLPIEVPGSLDGTPFVALPWGVALSRFARIERAFARLIEERPDERVRTTFQCDAQIARRLNEEQRLALERFGRYRLSLLCGAPGTGKTQLVRAIVPAWSKTSVVLSATTGSAANLLRSGIADAEVGTMHAIAARLLSARRAVDGIVVDEASMLSVDSSRLLLELLHAQLVRHLLLVGDPMQLPPVDAGAVFHDLVAIGRERQAPWSTELVREYRARTEEMRQLFAQLRRREIPDPLDQAVSQEVVLEIFDRLADLYGPEAILLTVPSYRGPCGVEDLNAQIARKLNPQRSRRFERGDIVISRRPLNTFRIYNGMRARVCAYREHGEPPYLERSLVVEPIEQPGVQYTFEGEDVDMWMLGYVSTIHRAQGVQSPVIVVVLADSPYPIPWSLYYTACTRAMEHLYVLGDPHRRMTYDEQRLTNLREFAGLHLGIPKRPFAPEPALVPHEAIRALC